MMIFNRPLLLSKPKNAVISPDSKYRYALSRVWDIKLKVCVFIGLNPSIADADIDDPTIRRCVNFARGWGCGSLIMLNLFAYRATDLNEMLAAPNPSGESSTLAIKEFVNPHDLIICAWGNHGTHLGRNKYIKWLLTEQGCHDLWALEVNKSGQPKHPLYVKSDITLKMYEI